MSCLIVAERDKTQDFTKLRNLKKIPKMLGTDGIQYSDGHPKDKF